MFIRNEEERRSVQQYDDPIIFRGGDVKRHRAYETYMRAMTGCTQAQKERLWEQLMLGFREQRALNERANIITQTQVDQTVFEALLHMYVDDSNLEEIYRENYHYFSKACEDLNAKKKAGVSLPTGKETRVRENFENFIRSIVRSSNHYFIDFANGLSHALTATGERDIALWSGGIDLSGIAFSCSHCPLEQTVLGKFLDTSPLVSEWAIEAPLWNIISRTFIAQNNTNVHIYFRLIDDSSVLMRQELPMFKKLHPTKHIQWHPIMSAVEGGLVEVGLREGDFIEISARNAGFPDSRYYEAVGYLESKLRLRERINYRVFEHANSECFQPAHPPFALDSDLDFKMVMDYLR